MGKHVLKDAGATIKIGTDAAVDISSRIRQVTLNTPVELQDLTTMGDVGRVRRPGLEDFSVELELAADFTFDLGGGVTVDSLLWDIRKRQEDEDVVVTVFPFAGLAHPASGNPEYIGKVVMGDHAPMGGSPGDAHTVPITLQGSDENGLVRDDTP